MLEIHNLHVSIKGTPVLKGIDLSIEPGETFILFGPNGSGKTTLLMTLMGVSGYEVTEGRIIFKGQDITHAPMYERARLGIGMSFQRPPTIHGLPTGTLVELCGRGREMDIPAMARKVHFDQFLDRDVNAGFSGGEIKRSELLQLMAQRPDLLLFDEPDSSLDLGNKYRMVRMIMELVHGHPGKAGLICLHDPVLALACCDTLMLLKDGRLICTLQPKTDSVQDMEKAFSEIYGAVRLVAVADPEISNHKRLILLPLL